MGVLERMLILAISFISTGLLYKEFGIPGWDTQIYFGGFLLFLVVAFLIQKVFEPGLMGSFFLSSLLTAMIMAKVSLDFTLLMGFVACFILMISAILWQQEQEYYRW